MTTERTPWWKAFLPKKKTGGCKDSASAHTFEADFDPFAQRQKGAAAAPKSSTDQSNNKHDNLLSDETYDDSRMESVFNEQTCRRNMQVSRSGRFRVKSRVRSSLPIEEKETGVSASEDVR